MTDRTGEEIYLTELETAVLQVFVRYKIFKDEDVVHELKILIEKLKLKK